MCTVRRLWHDYMWLWYDCDVVVMRLWCYSDVTVMWLLYGCDVTVYMTMMCRQCFCDVTVIWLWCECDVTVMWLWCNCIESVLRPCFWILCGCELTVMCMIRLWCDYGTILMCFWRFCDVIVIWVWRGVVLTVVGLRCDYDGTTIFLRITLICVWCNYDMIVIWLCCKCEVSLKYDMALLRMWNDRTYSCRYITKFSVSGILYLKIDVWNRSSQKPHFIAHIYMNLKLSMR